MEFSERDLENEAIAMGAMHLLPKIIEIARNGVAMKTFISDEKLEERIEANRDGGDGLDLSPPQSIDPNKERRRLAALQLANITLSKTASDRFYFAE